MKRSILPTLLFAALMPSLALGGEQGGSAVAKPTPAVDVVPLEGHREGPQYFGNLLSARFSPDARRLVSTTRQRVIRVWDGSTGKLAATLGPEREEALCAFDAVFLAGGKRVAACGPWMETTSGGRFAAAGGIVRIWDVERREEIFRFASSEFIDSISISSDEKHFLCLTRDSHLLVIDTTKDRRVAVKADLELAPDRLTTKHAVEHRLGDEADIAADGLRAVVILPGTKAAGGLILYDVARESVRTVTVGELGKAASHVPENPGQLGVRKVALSPDGRKLALVFSESRNSAQVLDFDSLEHAGTFALEPGQEVERLMFAPDSRL
ncbi:MAG: hypothetical protein SFX72_04615, partial [Isosphaeraceae bacterium]|nr:hypothetical protein [Isosphaeraceae bacterium]